MCLLTTACGLSFLLASQILAVGTKITRQSTSADLLEGKRQGVVIGSRGTIQLGRAAEVLADKFEDVWSVNSIVAANGTIYLGTSPNGGIYKYSLGKLTKIYPLKAEPSSSTISSEPNKPDKPQAAETPDDPNKPKDPNAEPVKADKYLSNQHVFAMSTDIAGRLLAGISGDKCKLCRFEADKDETIFEPNDAGYIFAITTDGAGNIYLGTGPQGKIYRLNPSGKEPQLIYDSTEKNILSLVIGPDNLIYAGTDGRGLIYKIDPQTKKASVLYDSEQPEVTALLFAAMPSAESSNLYAAATTANIAQTDAQLTAQPPMAGRPEPSAKTEKTKAGGESGLKLNIANTKKTPSEKPAAPQPPVRRGAKAEKASLLLGISRDGYVTEVFGESAVFFCLAQEQKQLIIGTGNDARLLTVDPASEQQAIIYEDQQASQITAIAVGGQDLYVGTANPAKLIKLSPGFASEGTYTSNLIDADQPARWGKFQIEADIPQGCKVMLACRSGNVKDVNDPSFSDWTEPTEIIGPVELGCPLGRFCQYKLILGSLDGQKSPLIREVALSSTIPNLAPKVESVDISRNQAPGKTGLSKITYKAKDDNNDKLTYKIDFRKIGRPDWIEIEDELEADNFEWDTKTVEDGRYEIRVVASDEKSNSPATKLTGSRISEPVVVDNTGPVIKKYTIESSTKAVILKMQIVDEISAIGELNYTVDSNAKWKGAVPDDLVCDTTEENFTLVIEKLEPGQHVVAVRVSDDLGNTTYKTFEVDMLGPSGP